MMYKTLDRIADNAEATVKRSFKALVKSVKGANPIKQLTQLVEVEQLSEAEKEAILAQFRAYKEGTEEHMKTEVAWVVARYRRHLSNKRDAVEEVTGMKVKLYLPKTTIKLPDAVVEKIVEGAV